MQKGFWEKLELPIIGLSPMDGVTDAPMRFVAKKYGKADILYTEFVSAEGLWRIEKRGEMENKIWQDLRFDPSQGPNIVQIFGSDPESFYMAAKIVCRLGFDGIDINMGCPSPGLERRGGGAGLIRDKCNAVEVVEATRRGVVDFFGSKRADFLGSRNEIATARNTEIRNDGLIPVSLKTRMGSDKPDPGWWKVLAGLQMPAVAMHGRTFKQLYSGEADWETLIKAGEVIRESGALFLGNGDIEGIDFLGSDQSNFSARLAPGTGASLRQNSTAPAPAKIDVSTLTEFAVELKGGRKLDLTGKMDGVLVGRGAIGNPWILNRNDGVSIEEKLKVAVEHSRKFEEMLPEQKFFVMRKHLVKYASGFPEITELRKKLVMSNSADEVETAVNEFLG